LVKVPLKTGDLIIMKIKSPGRFKQEGFEPFFIKQSAIPAGDLKHAPGNYIHEVNRYPGVLEESGVK